MRKTLIISSLLLLLFPILALAQTPLEDILGTFRNIIYYIIFLLMAAGTVVFLWGMVKYIMAGGDEKTKESSKGIIKTGIIGLFLMVAIWGIVRVLTSTFLAPSGLETGPIPPGPGYIDPFTR